MSTSNSRALLIGAAAASSGGGGATERSLRFNSADSAYLSNGSLANGNSKLWTLSFWYKASLKFTPRRYVFAARNVSNHHAIVNFRGGGEDFELYFYDAGGLQFQVITDRRFRDPGAWYHVVVAYDTDQSTPADRIKIYVNSERETSFATANYPSQGYSNAIWNTSVDHAIGKDSTTYFDGYLADIHFIDGQALDATSFGEFDATTGAWNPIEYAGTYGTNGFHLDFADNSSASALGTDTSGNGNNWTVNNFSPVTVPSGFKSGYYTGTGSATALPVSTVPSPDFVWIKSRSGASHALYDSIRGFDKRLYSNGTNAEYTYGSSILTPTSTGFNLTTSDADHNTLSTNYAAWCWDASGVSQTNYDPESTGATVDYIGNTNTGFSIVKCASPNNTETRAHGCGAAPDFIIAKAYNSSSEQWHIYHSALGRTYYGTFRNVKFNSSDQWGSQEPDSTYFYVKPLTASGANYSTGMIYYLWAAKAGYSAFGSYSGTGSSGNSVTGLGFKPAMVIIKSSSHDVDWIIEDQNITGTLYPNTADGEYGSGLVQFDDDGFTLTNTTTNSNALGYSYIYAAFAENAITSDIDSLRDHPTNGNTANDTGAGGEVPGNYCTFNPLRQRGSNTVSNGNLDVTLASVSGNSITGTFAQSSGKWYWEVTNNGYSNSNALGVGIIDASVAQSTMSLFGGGAVGYYLGNGSKYVDGASTGYGAAADTGRVIGVALDLDSGTKTITFYKDGVSQGTINLPSNFSVWSPALSNGTGSGTVSAIANFGQRAFAYSAPSGFKALCTANLDDPTIADGSAYMDVVTYTGNSSTQTIGGLDFSPDFVWIKDRTQAFYNEVQDTVRGAGNRLISDQTVAEDSNNQTLTAFTGDGFTVAYDASYGRNTNESGDSYVAWTWDAGSSTVSNTDGSITSSVRANPSAGFSIVTYTSSSSVSTVGHGLNVAPYLIITKARTVSNAWWTYHESIGNTKAIRLDTSDAAATMSSPWNNTSPTSSVFTVGGEWSNGNSIVAYAFAPVEGYSAFGSYVGNGNTDGPFVFTGFRPRWILSKCSSLGGSGQNWIIIDTSRDTYNISENVLRPNLSDAEVDYGFVDILSNGFKLRNNADSVNGSSQTYIYAAFAENPFKYARAR